MFISHSGADTWVARQISHHCQRVGADTFLDDAEIAIGADFEVAILNTLRKASELLVLITPWTLERPYVLMEIGAAWVRGLPIIVILYGITPVEFRSGPKVPVLLKRLNLLDINRIDRYFEELEKRVETVASI